MSAASSTLYTLTVDTEEEWDWDAAFPTSQLSLRNIDQLPRLQEVCSRHGAAVTYFEVLLSGTTLATLRRYQAAHANAQPRAQVAFPMTHESLAKVVSDLTGAG